MKLRIMIGFCMFLVVLINVNAYVPDAYSNINSSMVGSPYTPDTYSNVNSTMDIGGVTSVVDLCIVPVSGDWILNVSAGCVWDDDLTIPANISLLDGGPYILNATMSMEAATPPGLVLQTTQDQSGSNCGADGNLTDDDWSTSTSEKIHCFLNYTKPNYVFTSVIWETKNVNDRKNNTLPVACTTQSPLQLLVNTTSPQFGDSSSIWKCYNGTVFEQVYESFTNRKVFEEQIHWNASYRNGSKFYQQDGVVFDKLDSSILRWV